MIMELNGQTNKTEYLGIFGFSWQEKVASLMKKRLAGTGYEKKLASFWQAGGLNVTIINNAYNEYAALMARGYSPVSFSVEPGSDGFGGVLDNSSITLSAAISQRIGLPVVVVNEFLSSLYVMARDGKIPFSKFDPAGVRKSTAARKSFETERGFFDRLVDVGNTSQVLLFASLAVVVVIMFNKYKPA